MHIVISLTLLRLLRPVRFLRLSLGPMSPGPMIVVRLPVLSAVPRNGLTEGLSLKTTRVQDVEAMVIRQAIPAAGDALSRNNSRDYSFDLMSLSGMVAILRLQAKKSSSCPEGTFTGVILRPETAGSLLIVKTAPAKGRRH